MFPFKLDALWPSSESSSLGEFMKLTRLIAVAGLAAGVAVQIGPGGARAATPAAAVARDGPFGIAFGEPLSEVGPTTNNDDDPGGYTVVKPARANADLPLVAVIAFPSLGVCRIWAESRDITGDTTGVQVRAIIEGVATALQSKYGPPSAKQNTCTDLPQACREFWTLKISENKLTYEYDWKFADPNRPDKIEAIRLDADASNSITSWVQLTYFGTSDDKCEAAMKAAKASSL